MADNPELFADYTPYLAQVGSWPSIDQGHELTPVWSMTPQHAISAYRKLLRWAAQRTYEQASPSYEAVQRSPLAMALLNQAVGFEVLYADDLPPAPLGDVAHPLSDVTLEAVFDALSELDAHTTAAGGKPVHILSRARVLHDALTRKENP